MCCDIEPLDVRNRDEVGVVNTNVYEPRRTSLEYAAGTVLPMGPESTFGGGCSGETLHKGFGPKIGTGVAKGPRTRSSLYFPFHPPSPTAFEKSPLESIAQLRKRLTSGNFHFAPHSRSLNARRNLRV